MRHVIIGVAGLNKVKEYQDVAQKLLESHDSNMVFNVIPEPENPYDANALRIDSPLGTVGYVSRRDQYLLFEELGKIDKPTVASIHSIGKVSGADAVYLNLCVYENRPNNSQP